MAPTSSIPIVSATEGNGCVFLDELAVRTPPINNAAPAIPATDALATIVTTPVLHDPATTF